MWLFLLGVLAKLVFVAIAGLLLWDMYADARDGRMRPFRGLTLGILFIIGFVLFGGVFDSITEWLRSGH